MTSLTPWVLTLGATVVLGCATPVVEPIARSQALVPQSYEECVRAGGLTHPSMLGDRCILVVPTRESISAYRSCTRAGGSPVSFSAQRARDAPGEGLRCIVVVPDAPGAPVPLDRPRDPQTPPRTREIPL